MSATQAITVKIEITGTQNVTIVSSDAGAGSHISITTGVTMVTLHDLAAVDTYCGAWLHTVDMAGLLPVTSASRVQVPASIAHEVRHPRRKMAVAGPSLLIRAHGHDNVGQAFDRNRRTMLVRIGTVTWTVTDRLAYDSMTTAYRKAERMAQLVLPRI